MKTFLCTHTLFGFQLRTLLVVGLVTLIGGGALAADLVFKGAVYETLWEITGETSPAQQILGFGQYLARFTRAQPDTEPYADVPLADVNPFGVNTFLEQEVLPERRERQMQMIHEAGFAWIRQQFPWEDIEIDGKGDFVDRRNDLDLDGTLDPISAWDKYDHIVDLADQYGVEIIALLNTPPTWSHPPGTTNRKSPPADFQDFVDFAVVVASRYQGRVTHFQIWNEPNLYPEWGDQTVNAEAYTDLLCRTYDALKAIDPGIVVITGAIGPTVDLSGRNAYDLLYVQRLYQAGAGACFDVLSVQGYGLWSGPTDDRMRPVTINYARNLWIRDIMVANGDANKPIWISETAWNPVPNDPTIADLERYGRVTMEQAAEWAPLAYERAIEEWPWVGVVNWWFLKRAYETEQNQSWYYFRLLNPDFSPTPVYEALKAYMTSDLPKPLGAGRHGMGRSVIGTNADGDETRTFRFVGTDLYVCADEIPADVSLTVTLDGAPRDPLTIPAGSRDCTAAVTNVSGGTHTVTLAAPDWTGLDSLAVLDFSARHRLPWLLTGLIAAAAVLWIMGRALWVRLGV